MILRETKRLQRDSAYKDELVRFHEWEDRERERENDEITIKFRFTRNGGLEFIGLDAFREATFESAISRMSTMIFLTLLPLSRNTNRGRLHRTGRKRTLRGKCLVPYGRGP